MEGEKKIEKYAYSQKGMLGKGSYATVYRGRVIATDEPVAVKVMSKGLFKNSFNLKNVCSQIEIMKKLNHRNTVRMLDVFQTSNNMYLITEYCNQGDLMAFMRKRKKLPEKEALKIFQDILEGYRYLHTNKITHRDIKPANILIHDGVCKLVDFGFAKKADTQTVMCSLVGTPLYMSPQILRRQSYTSKADLWSVGLIFYELIFGATPWMAYNENQLLENIVKKPLAFPSSVAVSEQTKRVITACLQVNEEDRISWDALFDMVIIKRDRTPLREARGLDLSPRRGKENDKGNSEMRPTSALKECPSPLGKGRPTTPLVRGNYQGVSPLRARQDRAK